MFSIKLANFKIYSSLKPQFKVRHLPGSNPRSNPCKPSAKDEPVVKPHAKLTNDTKLHLSGFKYDTKNIFLVMYTDVTLGVFYTSLESMSSACTRFFAASPLCTPIYIQCMWLSPRNYRKCI